MSSLSHTFTTQAVIRSGRLASAPVTHCVLSRNRWLPPGNPRIVLASSSQRCVPSSQGTHACACVSLGKETCVCPGPGACVTVSGLSSVFCDVTTAFPPLPHSAVADEADPSPKAQPPPQRTHARRGEKPRGALQQWLPVAVPGEVPSTAQAAHPSRGWRGPRK